MVCSKVKDIDDFESRAGNWKDWTTCMKGLNTRIRGKDKDTSIKLVGKGGTKLIEPGADCIERIDTCKN